MSFFRAPSILNGEKTSVKDYKSVVTLKAPNIPNIYSNHFCAGVIVTNNHVLTAAHCVKGEKEDDVVLNFNSTVHDDENLQDVGVEEILIHPWFTGAGSVEHDVAILKVGTTFPSEHVAALREERVAPGLSVHACGWGLTEDDMVSSRLQRLEGVSTECNFPTETVICVQPLNDATSCMGDSGGGLFDKDNQLAGIISFTYVGKDGKCLPGSIDGHSSLFDNFAFLCINTNDSIRFGDGSTCNSMYDPSNPSNPSNPRTSPESTAPYYDALPPNPPYPPYPPDAYPPWHNNDSTFYSSLASALILAVICIFCFLTRVHPFFTNEAAPDPPRRT